MGFQNGASPVPAATGTEAQKISACDEALSSSPIQSSNQVDVRRLLLLRGAIRHELVEKDELDLKDAHADQLGEYLDVAFPLPENWAEACWDAPSWREAADWYHEELRRTGKPTMSRLVLSIKDGVAVFHKDIRFYQRALDDDISFDRAYRAIQERRGR